MAHDAPDRPPPPGPGVHCAAVAALVPGVADEVALAVTGLLIGALIVMGLWVWRARPWISDDEPPRAHQAIPSIAKGAAATSDEALPSPLPRPADSGPLSVASAHGISSPPKIYFDAASASHPRLCPRCDRRFPEAFETCPFDATKLRHQAPPKPRSAPKRLARRYCPQCDRRYELTALYCYHDGQKLLRDRQALSQEASTFKICRRCGWEGDDQEYHRCPQDQERLTLLEPANHERVAPVFPYHRCRRCGHIGPPSQSHCPVDGSLILPELNTRLTALPPLGHGPRRKVCPDCGAQFGGHCAYCSYDGEQLLDLN